MAFTTFTAYDVYELLFLRHRYSSQVYKVSAVARESGCHEELWEWFLVKDYANLLLW